MPELTIACPHCGETLAVQSEWAGMETSCPVCSKTFVIPSATAAVDPAPYAAEEYDEETEDERKARKAETVKLAVKILIALAIVIAGIVIYLKVTAVTPKSLKGNQMYAATQTRKNRDGAWGMRQIVKHDLFPVINSREDFFYRDAAFKDVELMPGDNAETYKGTMIIMRKIGGSNQTMKRPVLIERKGALTHYSFPFKYAENPRYLEEDGDLIFALATKIDKKLQGWKYVSGKAVGDGVLVCVISDGTNTKELRLKAEQTMCDDGVIRVWVEFPKPEK